MINTLAVTISSYAKTKPGTAWPFETFPNFENVVSNYRTIAYSNLIATMPIVADNQKTEWETYSSQEQGWINQSYAAIGLGRIDPLPIPASIYNVEEGLATGALKGPYMPVWQTSPPPKSTNIVNYNLASNSKFSDAFQIVLDTHEALFTQVTDISVIWGDAPDTRQSLLVQPIFQDANDAKSNIVGSLVASLAWDAFFSDLIRDGNYGMVCVLKNSCGDALTWKMKGSIASFMGVGDHHDRNYDAYDHVVKLTPFLTMTEANTPGYCEYEIHTYPSSELEKTYESNAPAVYTVVMVLLFVAFGACFLVYDYLVDKRQREAMDNAARSDAIISSLFPAEIRDRLFKGEELEPDKKAKLLENHKEMKKEELLQSTPAAQKFRLKHYLDEEGGADQPNGKELTKNGGAAHESKPIADLFPNTTVMFADIAG